MQQPELGRRLAALRTEENLTHEELVQKSHVSVRTIQRIEAGILVLYSGYEYLSRPESAQIGGA